MTEAEQLRHLHGIIDSGTLNYRKKELAGFQLKVVPGVGANTLVVSLVPMDKEEAKPVARVWAQNWVESEAGWGQRNDGWSIAKSPEVFDAVVKRWRAEESKTYGGATPPEYTRPEGRPFQVDLDLSVEQNVKALEMLDKHPESHAWMNGQGKVCRLAKVGS